jgi:hypothetical protein
MHTWIQPRARARDGSNGLKLFLPRSRTRACDDADIPVRSYTECSIKLEPTLDPRPEQRYIHMFFIDPAITCQLRTRPARARSVLGYPQGTIKVLVC